MEQAFQDLMWLSKRLAGIAALQNEVKDYAQFKGSLNEMREVAKKERDNFISTKEKRDKLESVINETIAEFETQKVKAHDEAKAIVSEAKKQAKDLLAKAKVTADAKIVEADQIITDLEDKQKIVVSKIADATVELTETETKLAKVKQELEALKSKF